MPTFMKAAHVDEVPPGKMKTVNINDQPIVLANVDGTIYAFSGICSHADGPLGRGKLLGNVVECPFHAGQFEVSSGRAVMPPATDDVPTYAARIEGDDIWVTLP
jgi:nitrite reductase/ring-hydroxylating ferredoxin subunit